MKKTEQFPFHRARRITPEEVEMYRKAIEDLTGKKRPKRPGRPPKLKIEKYVPISIRLHPQVFSWLKTEAKRKSLPYQTIINQILLREAA